MNPYRIIHQPIKHDWYLEHTETRTFQVCTYCCGHPDTVEDIDGVCHGAKYYIEKSD